jgi:hypothetical protein
MLAWEPFVPAVTVLPQLKLVSAVGSRKRHAVSWRERVHRNCSSRCNCHDAVESGTTEITIDRRRQIGRIGGNRAGHFEV